MRTAVVIAIAATLIASPAVSQQDDEGKSLMEQGMELFFEGLREEMSPALRDLRGLADEFGPPMRSFLMEMGPAMARIFEQVEDWTRYEAPEILPNGDIIIRRKPDPLPESDEPRPSEPTDI